MTLHHGWRVHPCTMDVWVVLVQAVAWWMDGTGCYGTKGNTLRMVPDGRQPSSLVCSCHFSLLSCVATLEQCGVGHKWLLVLVDYLLCISPLWSGHQAIFHVGCWSSVSHIPMTRCPCVISRSVSSFILEGKARRVGSCMSTCVTAICNRWSSAPGSVWHADAVCTMPLSLLLWNVAPERDSCRLKWQKTTTLLDWRDAGRAVW